MTAVTPSGAQPLTLSRFLFPQCAHGCGTTWAAGRRPAWVRSWLSPVRSSSTTSWVPTMVTAFYLIADKSMCRCSQSQCRCLIFLFSEMGEVKRNCTEDGWSEPFPHYVDVCFFYDNNTKPVRAPVLWPHLHFMSHLIKTRVTDSLFPTLGHVLRLGQGPVHGRLQHIAGVSDHSHGHPLQVQVSAGSKVRVKSAEGN